MPISSQYPNIDLPQVDIFTFLFKRKEKPFLDDKIIYQDGDDLSRKYTYSEVRKAAIEFGTGLKSVYGLRKGDVVALFTPNDVDTPIITFGTLWAGGVISPANPGYTVSELAYQLDNSGAKLVVAHFDVIETVKKACSQVGIPVLSIILSGASRDPSRTFKHWTNVKNLEGTARFRSPKINPKEDLAFLAYSSGTTGRPKGVMLTHYNMTSNILQITAGEAGVLSPTSSRHIEGIPDAPAGGDKILACLPFFHIYGLNCLIHAPMYNGIHCLIMARFEIEKWCSLVQENKVTFCYIAPPIAVLLGKHPQVTKYNLSSIRMANSGAAPLTRELQEAVFKRTGVRIKQGYGLSETSPTTHSQRWEDWNVAIGSVGWLQPNMQMKFCIAGAEEGVRGEAPSELPRGATGELYVKGPNIFKGYWKNEAATAECLSPDGWFRTGDVGHVDDGGNLFITDRVKELIKYKGFQVPPAELEGYLVNNELVDDVAVVGIDSEELGTEVPRAYIARKGGLQAVQNGDDQKIVDWLAKKVANHKKLRGGVKFVDAIPKSPSGKILRRLLKDQVRKEMAELKEKRAMPLKAKL